MKGLGKMDRKEKLHAEVDLVGVEFAGSLEDVTT